MYRLKFFVFSTITVLFVGSLLFLSYTFLFPQDETIAPSTLVTADGSHYFRYDEKGKVIPFDLLDPEESPSNIHEAVMQGFHILLDTRQYASEYTKSELSCSSCHFFGGNTLGGENGGISLVGVTNIYPKYSARDNKTISLKQRIQQCFLRSMNGKAPVEDSPVMNALIAYLEWISSELKCCKNIPWLGIKSIKMKKIPDRENGKKMYEKTCASCHQIDGSGTVGVPPLWGAHSFNTSAGMNKLPMLAPFIYWNMPKENPTLSDQEAIDIADYIISMPRPELH
ncbi:MAG: c-type cytochrome [Chlamydiales bacterium]|nr:c-type cytochrome [Chlamydiales bacterium]